MELEVAGPPLDACLVVGVRWIDQDHRPGGPPTRTTQAAAPELPDVAKPESVRVERWTAATLVRVIILGHSRRMTSQRALFWFAGLVFSVWAWRMAATTGSQYAALGVA